MYPNTKAVSPRDKEEFAIWKKFVDKISVDLAVIVKVEADESVNKSKNIKQFRTLLQG